MQTGKGHVNELILLDGIRHLRISCPAELIPAPGQYLLASNASDAPLPASLSYTDSTPGGFIAFPTQDAWLPGAEIHLRGPLGHGFMIPQSARRVCLIPDDTSFSRLRGLIRLALRQDASLVVVSDSLLEDLPDEVEVQPSSSLADILKWADYTAFDVMRESLPALLETLGKLTQASTAKDAQVLAHTPVPCGGVAECGVCAIVTKSGWKMTCKDGPVFNLREI